MLIKKISCHLTSFSFGYKIKDKMIILVWEIFFRIPSLLLFPLLKDYEPYIKGTQNIYKLLPDLMIKVDGCIFSCRAHSLDFDVLFPTFETRLKGIFEEIEKGIFIDVGSHVGKYTISVAKRLGNNGRVIAVEPNPSNFQALLKNIELNKLKNIIPLNLACFSKNSKIRFYLSEYDVQHSCVRKTENFITVESKTMDQIIKDLDVRPEEVKFVKIDVEGAEAHAFQGGKELFKKGSPLIVFECEDLSNFHRCKKILTPHDYKIGEIDGRNFLAYKSSYFSNSLSGISSTPV